MKTIFVIFALVGLVLADHMFDEFLAKYGKSYSGKEYKQRLRIFRENLKELRHQQELHKGEPVEYGVTKFFDMTKDEWRNTILSKPIAPDHLAVACLQRGVYAPRVPENEMDHPDSWDWRNTPNVVLSVKDQASCGSCWAFSTVENLEGLNGVQKTAMAGVDLSAQYIVDCSKGCSSEIYMGSNTTVCNGGCNGGWPWTALDDVATGSIAGVPAWSTYPYTGYTGVCKAPTGTLTKNAGYKCVDIDDNFDEDQIADYLYNNGPLSIAIDADPFYYYSSGIITASACPEPTMWLDHAILMVGYGTDSATGTKYWIVKNSWGTSWGMQGYAYIERGTGACGINEAVTAAYF